MEKLEDFNLTNNPFDSFLSWYNEAKESELNAEAFSFGTSDDELGPSVRYLLYKGIYENKFKIFGSDFSLKAQQLAQNPRAAMAFFWPSKMQQIRVTGEIVPMPREFVNEYFQTRPFESQIASLISRQSRPLESREYMLNTFETELKMNEGKELMLPSFWKGWLLVPYSFEFFIYREHRLNDRFLYKRDSENEEFNITRIWP